MIDSLRVARKAFAAIGASDSAKRFLTGYSEGGYAAMSAQRAMQISYASEFKVTAFAGQSGSYALALLSNVTIAGSPNAGGTVFVPLITTSCKTRTAVSTAPRPTFMRRRTPQASTRCCRVRRPQPNCSPAASCRRPRCWPGFAARPELAAIRRLLRYLQPDQFELPHQLPG